MRIEAVQNERRPYIVANHKHDLMTNVLHNPRMSKPNDPSCLNKVPIND